MIMKLETRPAAEKPSTPACRSTRRSRSTRVRQRPLDRSGLGRLAEIDPQGAGRAELARADAEGHNRKNLGHQASVLDGEGRHPPLSAEYADK
jgi:hypothetical protein